eukprot:1667256-Amphidinium_carterae.1
MPYLQKRRPMDIQLLNLKSCISTEIKPESLKTVANSAITQIIANVLRLNVCVMFALKCNHFGSGDWLLLSLRFPLHRCGRAVSPRCQPC